MARGGPWRASDRRSAARVGPVVRARPGSGAHEPGRADRRSPRLGHPRQGRSPGRRSSASLRSAMPLAPSTLPRRYEVYMEVLHAKVQEAAKAALAGGPSGRPTPYPRRVKASSAVILVLVAGAVLAG